SIVVDAAFVGHQRPGRSEVRPQPYRADEAVLHGDDGNAELRSQGIDLSALALTPNDQATVPVYSRTPGVLHVATEHDRPVGALEVMPHVVSFPRAEAEAVVPETVAHVLGTLK